MVDKTTIKATGGMIPPRKPKETRDSLVLTGGKPVFPPIKPPTIPTVPTGGMIALPPVKPPTEPTRPTGGIVAPPPSKPPVKENPFAAFMKSLMALFAKFFDFKF